MEGSTCGGCSSCGTHQWWQSCTLGDNQQAVNDSIYWRHRRVGLWQSFPPVCSTWGRISVWASSHNHWASGQWWEPVSMFPVKDQFLLAEWTATGKRWFKWPVSSSKPIHKGQSWVSLIIHGNNYSPESFHMRRYFCLQRHKIKRKGRRKCRWSFLGVNGLLGFEVYISLCK